MKRDPETIVQESEATLEELRRQFDQQERSIQSVLSHKARELEMRTQREKEIEESLKLYRERLDEDEITPLRAYLSLALASLGFLGASQLMSWTLTSLLPANVIGASRVIANAGMAVQAAIRNSGLGEVSFYVGFSLLFVGALTAGSFYPRLHLPRWTSLGLGLMGCLLLVIPYYDFAGSSSGVGLFEGALAASAIAGPIVMLAGGQRAREWVAKLIRHRYSLWTGLFLFLALGIGVVIRQYELVLAISLSLSISFCVLGLAGASALGVLRTHASLLDELRQIRNDMLSLQQTANQQESRLTSLPELRSNAIRNEYDRRDRLLRDHELGQRWAAYIGGGN